MTLQEVKNTDEIREAIINLENTMKEHPDSFVGDTPLCPLEHSFSDGIYVRQISIPQGMMIVGKLHKHAHPNFLLKGEVMVVTEEGESYLQAPCSMISKAGTKRALYAITDLVWTTIHHNPTNTQDLEELEKIVIAGSFKELGAFQVSQKRVINRAKKMLIKILSK